MCAYGIVFFLRKLQEKFKIGLVKLHESCIISTCHGDVAQLGERTVRIREVEGSSPFISTMKKTLSGVFFCGKMHEISGILPRGML